MKLSRALQSGAPPSLMSLLVWGMGGSQQIQRGLTSPEPWPIQRGLPPPTPLGAKWTKMAPKLGETKGAEGECRG